MAELVCSFVGFLLDPFGIFFCVCVYGGYRRNDVFSILYGKLRKLSSIYKYIYFLILSFCQERIFRELTQNYLLSSKKSDYFSHLTDRKSVV